MGDVIVSLNMIEPDVLVSQWGRLQMQGAGPRAQTQSKQALSQMLKMRLPPSHQFLGGPGAGAAPQQQGPPGFPQNMQRQQFIRQQLRAQHSGMFPQQQPPAPTMYSGMQQGIFKIAIILD